MGDRDRNGGGRIQEVKEVKIWVTIAEWEEGIGFGECNSIESQHLLRKV